MNRLRSKLFGKLSMFSLFNSYADLDSAQLSIPEHKAPPRAFSLEVEYLPKYRCVKITTHGSYTMEADEQVVAAGIKATRQYKTNLVLIDQRDQELGLKFVEVYDLSDAHEQMHVPHDVRVAILFTPTQENLSRYRLYENRSVILGFKHHVFTDERSARAWLFSPETRLNMGMYMQVQGLSEI